MLTNEGVELYAFKTNVADCVWDAQETTMQLLTAPNTAVWTVHVPHHSSCIMKDGPVVNTANPFVSCCFCWLRVSLIATHLQLLPPAV